MEKRKPELLAPAGGMEMLETALKYGADAVYGGIARYSLRVKNNDFVSIDSLKEGIDYAHAAGKKFYVVANVYPHNNKIATFAKDVGKIVDLQPDALIMADPGMIDVVLTNWRQMPVHLSVQANTINWGTVKFWRKQGVSRVILSRELRLEEVREIREACPDCELEVFVHGALCIAYSGRCLLSGYFNKRDANQGACTNSCRWNYKTYSKDLFLEEQNRPGEYMPIDEDEHGTYILNSKDLRAASLIGKLTEIGIDSFKIEGRTKSAYYAARTCKAYRQAIDAAYLGQEPPSSVIHDLDSLANRGYTSGFLGAEKIEELQNYATGRSTNEQVRYVGKAVSWSECRNLMEVQVKNRFDLGAVLEFIMPQENGYQKISRIEDANGAQLPCAPGDPHKVWVDLPKRALSAFLASITPQT